MLRFDLTDYTGLIATLDFHHVGILTSNAALPNLNYDAYGRVDQFGCTCYIFNKTEFVVPDPGSALDSRLMESGPRLHHIAVATDCVETLARQLRGEGFRTLTDESVKGIGRMRVHFIIPDGRGVMLELVEEETYHAACD